MRSSFRLFRVAGISVEVHLTFILFFLLFALLGFPNMLFILVVFSLVLAHELCHSIAAILSGIKVPRIILLPFGGLSSIEIPENPVKELRISLAGPFFNFFLAGVCLLLMKLSGLGLIGYFDVLNMLDSGNMGVFTPSFVMSMLVMSNLVLGTFNMIPAFPMDGGRVLRSMLALWFDYVRATKIAGAFGNLIFMAMFVLGLLTFFSGGIWLIVMSWFLSQSSSVEVQFVMLRNTFSGMSMRELVSSGHKLPVVDGRLKVAEFLRVVARPEERFYLVVNPDGSLRGVLDVQSLGRLAPGRDALTVGAVAQDGYGVVSSGASVADGMREFLARDITLVVDGSVVVGYVTPELFAELTHFYNLYYKTVLSRGRR
ncbi:MAG: site-2 protease family protein [Candidatus Altiarchaeota archaeon]|nr:site-2 protease family protein [Candidatus Altiarchaeota archaeon]